MLFMKKIVNVTVDEKPIKVGYGFTIMQSCSQAGIDVPRFCYHDKLLIAGNCRICLVEVVGSKKLLASCAVHASENITIYTNTSRVRLARQNVLEFLLANHPLDCPICDQGGECDLQDITAVFGADRGRFYETKKRAVLNKDFGPLIRTSMNRCIHCTRCVRFLTFSSGKGVLGTLGRGSSTEIGTYISQFLHDELSGNITDLCPVGALTSKPYSFKARPWELTSVESLDVFDSLNSNLLIDVSANKICRVLPYANEKFNETWLSNKARYAYDGLFIQRISGCLIKIALRNFLIDDDGRLSFFLKKVDCFVKISWNAAFAVFAKKLTRRYNTNFTVDLGDLTDLNTALSAKLFSNFLGASTNLAASYNTGFLTYDYNFLYLFNTALSDLTTLPSFCLFIGLNTRFDSPLLNLRLNQLYVDFTISFYRIGASMNYSSYPSKLLSNNLGTFVSICEFKHIFCKNFYVKTFLTQPLILLSGALLNRFDSFSILNAAFSMIRRLVMFSSNYIVGFSREIVAVKSSLSFLASNYINIVSQSSSQIHRHEVGFNCGILNFTSSLCDGFVLDKRNTTLPSIYYAIGVDRSGLYQKLQRSKTNWVIYQGSHGNGLAGLANLVMPSVSFVEKSGFYKNLLGYTQKTKIAVNYDVDAKTDLMIFKSLLSSAYRNFFIKFFTFSFHTGIHYNLAFAFSGDFFKDSYVLDLGRANLSANKRLLSYYYLSTFYSYFSSLPVSTIISSNFWLSHKLIIVASIGSRILTTPVSSSSVNYYGDSSNMVVLASKAMSLSSTIFLKKNFSVSHVYL